MCVVNALTCEKDSIAKLERERCLVHARTSLFTCKLYNRNSPDSGNDLVFIYVTQKMSCYMYLLQQQRRN